MNNKKSFLQKYDNIAKIYNQIWIIAIILSVGLIVMQFVSGNLTSKNPSQPEQAIELPCKQTPDEEVTIYGDVELKTDISLSIIENKEIFKTNLGANDIPPVNNPKFSKGDDLANCIAEDDQTLVLTTESTTKIYPIKILQQHLVINDELDGTPILVSYCALCNSPKIYKSIPENNKLVFGTTGLLYKNNDLLFDEATNSLWAQLTGQALVGELLGHQLEEISFQIFNYKDAVEKYPDANVLNFDTGSKRNYQDTSFKDFPESDYIVGPVKNSSELLPQKTLILGFRVNNNYYAIEQSTIEEAKSLQLSGGELEVSKAENQVVLSLNDKAINYTQAYWYVWYDFYPETILLK